MGYYVLMGVSGCGKTSVGTALAELCDIDFIDGDDLHPKQNIEKMTRGEPLTDEDRAPWLGEVGATLARHKGPVAIGCSALKRMYRDIIRARVHEPLHFLHLDASREVLSRRVNERSGHFMPTTLLDSQFAALERLGSDELGAEIDISRAFSEVVESCAAYVKETMK